MPPSSQSPNILCVDDEPNALIIRKLLLQRAGYTVFAALNCETALQLFKEHHFDLVVSDHFLSGERGAILARELRLFRPTIPIVLLSGSIEPPEHSEVADAFIVKGDDPSLLLERVASVLKTASQSDDPEAQSRSLCSHILHFRDGDHVCFPYDNESEQMKAVVQWIHAGLRHEEKCRYFADDNSVAEVMHHLETAGMNVQRECKRGALAFATKHDTYLRSGRFEPNEMVDLLQQDVADSAKNGFRNYRVSGEMTWALGVEPGCDRLIEYENKLDRLFNETRALCLCQYSRNRFSSSLLTEVAAVHHLGLSKSKNSDRWNLRVRRNQFYADMVEDREPQQFQYCFQRDGSRDVIELGTGSGLKETRRAIEARLRAIAAQN
jgi:CheY-like chemotaxis protein